MKMEGYNEIERGDKGKRDQIEIKINQEREAGSYTRNK